MPEKTLERKVSRLSHTNMLSIEKVSRGEVNPNTGRRMDAMLDFAEERGLEKTFVGHVTCPYT